VVLVSLISDVQGSKTMRRIRASMHHFPYILQPDGSAVPGRRLAKDATVQRSHLGDARCWSHWVHQLHPVAQLDNLRVGEPAPSSCVVRQIETGRRRGDGSVMLRVTRGSHI